MAQVIYDFQPNPLAGLGDAVGILGKALDERWSNEQKKGDATVVSNMLADMQARAMAGQGPIDKEAMADYFSKIKTPEYQGVLMNILGKQAYDAAKPYELNEGGMRVNPGGQNVRNPKSFAPQVTGTGAYTFNNGGVQFTQPDQIQQQQGFENEQKSALNQSIINRNNAAAAQDRAMIDKIAREKNLPRDEVERINMVGKQLGYDISTPEGFAAARDALKSEISTDPAAISREAGKQAGSAVAQGIAYGTIKPEDADTAYQKLYDAAYNAMSKNAGPKTKGAAPPPQNNLPAGMPAASGNEGRVWNDGKGGRWRSVGDRWVPANANPSGW